MNRPLSEFSDAELAAMIRNGCYAKGTSFGEDTRFLLVLAVPYGPVDTVHSLREAIDGFFKLVQDDDYAERSIQVYDHEAREPYFETQLEVLSDPEIIDASNNHGQ